MGAITQFAQHQSTVRFAVCERRTKVQQPKPFALQTLAKHRAQFLETVIRRLRRKNAALFNVSDSHSSPPFEYRYS